MADSAGYTLFDDLDEDDGDSAGSGAEGGASEEPPAGEEKAEPGMAGGVDVSALKVPVMDNVGYVGSAGGLSDFTVFKDQSYNVPTISGLGGPGWSNWTPDKELAQNNERSQRNQAAKAMEQAVQQKDAMRCAACIVQHERLGMDTSTPTAELAAAIADQEYLEMMREAQRNKELEDELREFAELAEAGAFAETEAGEDEPGGEWAEREGVGGSGTQAEPPAGVLEAEAAEESPPARPKRTAAPQRREEQPAAPSRPQRRKKSPSLAERLLLGANVAPPSSASDEGVEEEDDGEWPACSGKDAGEQADGQGGDPDLQLVGAWQYGSQATERLRISRPERGLLLVDRQLPTGIRASGTLRRGDGSGMLHASLAVKDGQPAGEVRVRPVDATHLVVGLKNTEEADWSADVSAERTALWCCCPPEKRPLGIREVPEFDGARTGKVLRPGEVFCVSAEVPAPSGGVLWLRLADDRGWVFDRQPGAASLCVRCDLPISGFSVLDGYTTAGGEIHYEEVTLEEAKVRSAALPDCCGFSYEGGPKPTGPVGVIFKNRWQHAGAGEETGWTSVRVERGPPQAGLEAAAGSAPAAEARRMTPAEEEEARNWYESISQGWLTRLKPEGANEGGINALEDIIASMDRCDVADDPELAAVRKGFERANQAGCTALTPLTREDQALVPTGKLTSSLRPYSAKEGDDVTEPNAAVARLTGRAWVSEFRKHHPAARVSPGLALRAVTGEEGIAEADDAEVLPAGGGGSSSSRPSKEPRASCALAGEGESDDEPGRELPWWQQREVEVSEAPSLQDRTTRVNPAQPWKKAKPKERSRMAMPKARPLTASSSSQPRARSGILPASSSGVSPELGSELSGLFS